MPNPKRLPDPCDGSFFVSIPVGGYTHSDVEQSTDLSSSSAMTVQPPKPTPSRHRFTVDDYYQMVKTGILSEGDRTELIEGEIIEMVPIGSRHAGSVDQLNTLLSAGVGDATIVRVQSPIRLDAHSEPQPDLTLLEARDDFYSSAHPTPDDVLLVVEVSDASLEYDRAEKIPLYADHRIPVVWLINLRDRCVELYERPDDEGYQIVHSLRGDATVEYDELGLRFDVEELFV